MESPSKRQKQEVTCCSHEQLQSLATEILVKHGANQQVAEDCSVAMVRASLRGIDSHGIALLPRILERDADSEIMRTQLTAICSVVLDSPAVALLDAALAPGQHACMMAARMAAEKAAVCGISIVNVRDSTHFGASASFLEELLSKGMVGIVGSNCTPSMAILGSSVPNSGNSPWGFCAPVADGPDFLFDFCCAVMSFGKLNRLKAAGTEIPEGAFIEALNEKMVKSGTNAAAVKNIALAFGGVKGGMVAMMIEVLSGVLSNGNFGANAESVTADGKRIQGPSHFVIAIDPSKFGCSSDEFAQNMKSYLTDVKAPASEIRYAGESAAAAKEERGVHGVPLTAATKAEIEALAKAKNIKVPW